MPVRIQATRKKTDDWLATAQAMVDAADKAFSQTALALLQRYPPPNSDYVRTGNLGRSWTAHKTPQGVTVRNDVRYASYVQGPQGKSGRSGGQTAVMAGKGWMSITEAGKQAVDAAAKAANGQKMVTRNYGFTL